MIIFIFCSQLNVPGLSFKKKNIYFFIVSVSCSCLICLLLLCIKLHRAWLIRLCFPHQGRLHPGSFTSSTVFSCVWIQSCNQSWMEPLPFLKRSYPVNFTQLKTSEKVAGRQNKSGRRWSHWTSPSQILLRHISHTTPSNDYVIWFVLFGCDDNEQYDVRKRHISPTGCLCI